MWADGIYLGAGLEPESSCLLVIVGARADGHKELLGMTQVWEAPTRAGCEHRRDELAVWLHAQGQDSAAETLYRDWDDFVAFYDF